MLDSNETIQLQPITAEKFNFVNFTNNGPILATDPIANRIQFWNKLYRKYFNIKIHT